MFDSAYVTLKVRYLFTLVSEKHKKVPPFPMDYLPLFRIGLLDKHTNKDKQTLSGECGQSGPCNRSFQNGGVTCHYLYPGILNGDVCPTEKATEPHTSLRKNSAYVQLVLCLV